MSNFADIKVYPVTSADVKKIPKRTRQIGIIAIAMACILSIANHSEGMHLSAFFIEGFCLINIVSLFLNYKGLNKYPQGVIAISTCAVLILSSMATGLRAGGYLYFFPLLVALTSIVDHEKSYKSLRIYYLISIASFFCCLIFANYEAGWEDLRPDQYNHLFYSNCSFSLILTLGFCYLNIVFEQRYATALTNQKNKAEEAMHSRTRFLSNMGHELRTPLNGIIGTVDLLTKQPVLPEQQEYLNVLKYCSDHMFQQINDFLDFSKIEAGKLELYPVRFNLKTLLLNSTLPFHNRFEEKGLHLNVEIEEVDFFVKADDIRLIQILNNLLSNSLKYTEEGHVLFSAKGSKRNNRSVQVDFEVSDSGIGIDPEDQKRIFEGYSQILSNSTRKYGGTGLGLSITRKFINMMGAELHLESEKGKGSRFSFAITFDLDQEKEVTVNPKETTSTDLEGIKILVAEDNKINMMIARKLLEGWNANLALCNNGLEALSTLEKDSDFQLILLDLEMPEMDGYAAIKVIREKYPQIPVIAFTASLVDNQMYEALLDAGFSDCVLKPFQPLNLLSKIRQHTVEKAEG